jgi:hypothetical protein
MDDNTTLSKLEELAHRLGIKIRYEPLNTKGSGQIGGFCRIKGEDFVIMNNKAASSEKIHVLIDALKRSDISEVYILPSLRKILDNQGDQ